MTSEQPSPNSLPEQPDLRGAVPADGQPTPADRETVAGPEADPQASGRETVAGPQATGSVPEADPSPAGEKPAMDPGAAAPAYREVTVRRAPKFIPFMAVGAILGFLAALVIAYTGPEDPTLTRESVLGFFTVVLALPGLLLAALLVLVFDRRSIKRAERARAERTLDDGEA